MAAATPPLPVAILEQHLRVSESLRALGQHHRRVTTDPTSRFLGMTPDEFDAALREAAEEQDKQAVLMLAASCEAVLRLDFAERVRRPLSRRTAPDSLFIELARRSSHRTRLDDIIDAWKTATGQTFTGLSPLLKRRHWLAHGRSWSDKSGYHAEPQLVFNLIASVFQAIKTQCRDFPRL